MRFRLCCTLLLGLLPSYLAGQSCPPQRTALVLSGGGAKGLAHIGVLRAMDSLGVRPDLIVGSSMGAIIGGLYASGYSARQIDSLARNLPLSSLFRTYEPRVPITLGNLQPIVVWEDGPGGLVFQRAAVLEPEVNALLNAGFLLGNLQALGNFDSLPIPFRAVATDLLSGDPVVFSSGDLARAIRASAAIPLLFEPEIVNGRFLGDGGLSANVPIRVARAEGATRVIVSYTTEPLPDSLNLQSTLVLIDHLIGNLFRQPQDSLGNEDLPIRPDVEGFRSLNFSSTAVSALITRGVTAAYQPLQETPCLSRADHRVPTSKVPVLKRFSVSPSAAHDSAVLQQLMQLKPGAPIDIRELQQRLRQLGTSERYASIWLFPGGTPDSVSLTITPQRTAPRIVAVGATYDNDLGGRVWLGQVDRQALGQASETAAAAFLGELRQELYAGLRLTSVTQKTVVPVLELRGSRELVRQFQNGNELSRIKVHEGVAFAGLELGWKGNWRGTIGAEGRMWDAPAGVGQSAFGARMSLSKPGRTAETLFHLLGQANNQFRRLEVEGIVTIRFGRLRIRPRGRFGIGESLPLQHQFVFGGVDGFAGRHLGELRSERELSGSLVMLFPLRGQLDFRLEPMAGASGGDGGLLPEGEVHVGLRAGLNLATGIGPIRVEYGVSEGGRDALLVRFGQWF